MQKKLDLITRKLPTLEEIFSSKSDVKQIMSEPYTILIKKLENGIYSWIVYSLGKNRNIVWGTLRTEPRKVVDISYGCRYHNLSILNKMLDMRRIDGYTVVSTLAKDRINPRIQMHLIADAYHKGNSYTMVIDKEEKKISSQDLQDMVLDLSEKYEEFINEPSDDTVMLVSKKIAESLLDNPNVTQVLSSKIPQYVMDHLHDFIEYAGFANIQMPIECPSYAECEDDQAGELEDLCELYQKGYSML